MQGRIVSEAPPTLIGATKRVEGKPVVSKRILLPDVTPDGDGADDTR
ncbi:hypothetical protein I552_4129 [Mycobacterium xenopi 3993]|nr:hypothetical protein I552_4129 [Mycobacterium xenopi 3993]